MGNQLCAPWRKGYRDDDHHWTPRKDSHLLRLWAEIFEVQEENGEICWARVSDDVVPVNITCIQNHPNTVFQITAYNRHVEKIFDVRLIQPGTRITQASECFVHWKDSKCEHEWGLNFTTPLDARRFRDCCMTEKIQGRKAASNPTSPVAQPRRAISSPEELAVQEAIDAGFLVPRGQLGHQADGVGHYSEVAAIATAPRVHKQSRQIPHVQTAFPDHMQRQQACENIYSQISRQKSLNKQNGEQPPPSYSSSTVMHQPIAEREIPYSQYIAANQADPYGTCRARVGSRDRNYGYAPATEDRRDGGYGYASMRDISHEAAYSATVGASGREGIYGRLGARPVSSDQTTENLTRRSKETTSLVGQELRQFSREPTVLNFSKICDNSDSSDKNGMDSTNYITPIQMQDPPISKKLSKLQQQLNNSQDKGHVLSESPKENDSSHEDTSVADLRPPVGLSAGFDSNTLKRMLQVLPEASPTDQVQFDFKNVSRYILGSSHVSSKSSSPVNINGNKAPSSLEDSVHPPNRSDSYSRLTPFPEPTSSTVTTPASALGLQSCIKQPKTERSEPASELEGRKLFEKDSTCLSQNANSTKEDISISTSIAFSQPNRNDLIVSDLKSNNLISNNKSMPAYQTSGLSDKSENEGSSLIEIDKGNIKSDLCILPYESQAMFSSKSTAIRKVGCLLVQNWLFHKMVTVVVASSRAWNKFWVCLKGTLLLFFGSELEANRPDSRPRHILVVSGCITYPHLENAQMEGVFSLSTIFGDAYLFQASSANELDSWILNIHLACASSFARNLGRENAAKLIRNEIHKLENSIDLDLKMKKMAGMQAHIVSDPLSRQALDRQMTTWEENLERLYIEQFQLRCYLAALQRTEIPSSNTLLSNISKSTRLTLTNLGVVSVTSFHALVCARMPMTMTGSLCHASKGQGQCQGLSTFKADTNTKIKQRSPRPLSLQPGQDSESYITGNNRFADENHLSPENYSRTSDTLLPVTLPDGQSVTIQVNEKTTVQELLECICTENQLNSSVYFIRVKQSGENNFKIPEKTCLVLSEDHESVELCAKLLFQAEIVRNRREKDFGFTVEAKSPEDSSVEDELCVFIADVTKGAMMASRKGLQAGDELLVLNGLMVSELDMIYIETLLDECDAISLTVRSCRCIDRSCQTSAHLEHSDEPIDHMTGSTPSTQLWITNKLPDKVLANNCHNASLQQQLQQQNEKYDNVAGMDAVQMAEPIIPSDESHPQMRTMSDAERICKIIMELIETERQYVRDLNCLIDWYLEPLKAETFLTGEDIEHLFGNIQEIVQFQKLFLQSLEEAVDQELGPITDSNESIQFKKILFSLGSAFLYYAHHFKLYSSFCASHSKAQKMLVSESNIPLQNFLRSRNPKQQHSATIESCLIKPIQRILKYPLLLRQLKELTDPNSEEHAHLREALHGMEAVAEHINEMQKIYEEYGSILDELSKQYKDSNPPHSKSLDLNVGELQMYGTVNWLNALDELGKMKKGMELLTLLFIFKSGVVLMAQERLKGKRKVKPVQGRPAPCIGDNSNGGARFKAAIPVDQLQVRTMVGDAHECHGIWEMVHCGSEKENRPEKIFQFASSQEARRDFIRTIHYTIRESVQRMSIPAPKDCTRIGQSQNALQQSHPTSIHCSPTQTKRPESLATSVSRGGTVVRQSKTLRSDLSVRHSMDIKDPSCHAEGELRARSNTLVNLADRGNDMGLGSQLTLASDRCGARLVHTSHDPTHYSSQNIHKDSLGSPIWKPRSSSRRFGATQSPVSSEDAHSEAMGFPEHTGKTSTEGKQRVAFKIPPDEYREVEDTDC